MSDFFTAAGTAVSFTTLLTGLATFGPWVFATFSALTLLIWLTSRTIHTVLAPLVAMFGNKTRSSNARALLEMRSGAATPRKKGPS